ncbi:hypothetical protein M0812_28696 [Anaeramoeba flamelloides]|uniref:Stealth protein CR2 conserved region 2 domain-containing protein n=1 Tax=Anaeramoeba flamelloides TaxID=1746091 RepID=A0AAV7YC89_9EUKA|nr:hypothetical protein M0812_28696 [Anaeramoeba flamelloides]
MFRPNYKRLIQIVTFLFLFILIISHIRSSGSKDLHCSSELGKEIETLRQEYTKLQKDYIEIDQETKVFEIERSELINERNKDKYQEENEKIDVVFTWGGIIKDMDLRNRYNYELQFSIRSVHKHLPWVNKIYVLINSDTDYPYWIKREDSGKIIVYDRCTLFENPDHCPTYNTFAVFSVLHKIEGLGNKFILIDDDVFINQLLTPDYFFTKEGCPRVFQPHIKSNIYEDDQEFTDIKRPQYKYARFSHLPKPMRKDLIIKFHEEYPDYAKLVQSHLKRYKKLSEEISMIYYEYFFEMDCLKPEEKIDSKFYQIPHKHPEDITQEFEDLYEHFSTRNIKTFNCNDDYSTDEEIYPKQRKVLWDFYMKLYPETPDYEIPNPDHVNYS